MGVPDELHQKSELRRRRRIRARQPACVRATWSVSKHDLDLTVRLPVDMQAVVQEILAPKPYRLYVKTIGKGVNQDPVISSRDIFQCKTPVPD